MSSTSKRSSVQVPTTSKNSATSAGDLTAQLADRALRVTGSRTPALSYAVATTSGVLVAGAVGTTGFFFGTVVEQLTGLDRIA